MEHVKHVSTVSEAEKPSPCTLTSLASGGSPTVTGIPFSERTFEQCSYFLFEADKQRLNDGVRMGKHLDYQIRGSLQTSSAKLVLAAEKLGLNILFPMKF